MTTVREVGLTCAACGAWSKHMIIRSSNSYDTELDGSPVGMARESAFGRPPRCPKCGHCSPNIEVAIEGLPELVASEHYQGVLNAEGVPDSASACMCAALVLDLAGYPRDSFALRRMAAWMCDDAGLVDDARACRVGAIETAEIVLQKGGSVERDRVDQLLVLADLYRRVGMFEEAAEGSELLLAALREDMDEKRLKVAEFQAALIVAEDESAHTYGEAGEDCRFPNIFLL